MTDAEATSRAATGAAWAPDHRAAPSEQVVSSPEQRTPYKVAARELLRRTLFDAARDELASRSWSEVRMLDIAIGAGVSRGMLYKEFASREEFAQALVLRESDSFFGAVEAAMDAHLGDPRSALMAGLELFLSVVAADPVARAVTVGDSELVQLATTQGGPLVERSTERLHSAITARWPQVKVQDAALLAECIVRLAISYAVLPAGRAREASTSVTVLLGPYIERAVRPEK